MNRLMEIIRNVDKAKGFFYWGGECLPVPGCSWASPEAIAYMHEKGPGGNEWCNQALFDYDGNALPILDRISEFE